MENIKLTFANKEVQRQWQAGRPETSNIAASIQNRVNRASETPEKSIQRSTRSKSGLSFIFNN